MYQSTQLFQFAYFYVNCIYFLNRYLFVEYLFSASPKILKEGNCGKLKSSDLILNQQIIQKFVQDIADTADSFDKSKFGGTWLKPDAVPTLFNFAEVQEGETSRNPISRQPPKKRRLSPDESKYF